MVMVINRICVLGCVGVCWALILDYLLVLVTFTGCMLYYILCVNLFGCFVTCVACYLWVDRVIVCVGVRSKLGVDGLKEMDGYMDEWMSG